jgi:hypothetical protein
MRDSVAIGSEAMASHTDLTLGCSNIAIGNCSMKFDVSGSRNVAVGDKSMGNQTCGCDNIAIGSQSLQQSLTGLHNIAVGSYALSGGGQAVHGSVLGNNVVVGWSAGMFLGTCDMTGCAPGEEFILDNVFVGTQAGTSAKVSCNNTFVGGSSGSTFYDGKDNVAIGYNSARLHRYGDNNITIGACVAPISGAFTTVSNKIVIGNGFHDSFKVSPGAIDFEATATGITIAGTTEVKNYVSTTTATTQFAIAEFAIADYVGGKFIIQATDTTTSDRHITEVLMTHNGTTAVATEYGIVTTNTSLFTVDVDISASNARVLITPASTNSTKFTISGNMILT